MAEHFTDEEIEGFKNAFRLLDREENGLVSLRKIGVLLRSVGENPSEQQIRDIINVFQHEHDEDKGSLMDFTEFLIIVAKVREHDEEKDILEVFNVFDKTGKGFLRTDELRAALDVVSDEIPPEDIAELIADFDENGDGCIRYEEFASLMGFHRADQATKDSAPPTPVHASEDKK